MSAHGGFRSDRLADEEMVEGAFLPRLEDRLVRPVGPPHHPDRGGRIVRHEVYDLSRLDAVDEIVELRQYGGALRPDLDQVVIRERGKATDVQRPNLVREPIPHGVRGPERLPIRGEVRRPQSCDPSVAVEGIRHEARTCEHGGIDLLEDAANRSADRPEELQALEGRNRSTPPVGLADRLRRDFRGPTRYRGVDRGDSDEDVAVRLDSGPL